MPIPPRLLAHMYSYVLYRSPDLIIIHYAQTFVQHFFRIFCIFFRIYHHSEPCCAFPRLALNTLHVNIPIRLFIAIPCNHINKHIHIQRLCHMCIHSCIDTFPCILLKGIGGHSYYRYCYGILSVHGSYALSC